LGSRHACADFFPTILILELLIFFIEAEFATGELRRFDMRPYLNYPAFAALSNTMLFMRAYVENGVVVWNDEIDLSPDTLYLRGLP
jgi:hypothetical protein